VDITQLLKQTVAMSASDLHLSSGALPQVRVDGELQSVADQPISAEVLTTAIAKLLKQRQIETRDKDMDLSYSIEGVARFRVNIFNQLKGPSIVFRVIPERVQTLESLDLPEVLTDFCSLDNGLVLVTGPTGSGKSTTLAAMIYHINQTQSKHILTLEDPIEFVHENAKCLVQQREIHQHTDSFHSALRAALREDPDVILVGEMRDVQTIRLALTAAETGHLVFATLHTSSAAKTINRIIDVFPAGEKEMVRSMLSESLKAVAAQVLLKRKGGGRVAAHEIMVCTPAVRNLIREDKIQQIPSALQTGSSYGMVVLEKSIERLKSQGVIE
jgi:twitching motility protein PilT